MDNKQLKIKISDNTDTRSVEKIFQKAGWKLQSVCIVEEDMFAIFESGAK